MMRITMRFPHATIRYAIQAILLLAGLMCANAYAANMNRLDNCTMVPRVTWQPGSIANSSTAIGLINRNRGVVYWAFYDANGTNLVNGLIPPANTIDPDSLSPFVWDPVFVPEASGFANVVGYMLFCLDTDSDTFITLADDPTLAANAFFVDRDSSDVAYIPTVSLGVEHLNSDVPDLVNRPIEDLPEGADSDALVDVQYAIDAVVNGGDETEVYFFTTQDPGPNLVIDFLDGMGGVSLGDVSVPASQNLTILNPETVAVPPTVAPSGFIGWFVVDDVNKAFVFSVVKSPVFGASQTLMGNAD